MTNYRLKKYVVISCLNFGINECRTIIELLENNSIQNFPYDKKKFIECSIMKQFIERNKIRLEEKYN